MTCRVSVEEAAHDLEGVSDAEIENARKELIALLIEGEEVFDHKIENILFNELESVNGFERTFWRVQEIVFSEYPETPLLQMKLKQHLAEVFLDGKENKIAEWCLESA